jgi:hypothetical protein
VNLHEEPGALSGAQLPAPSVTPADIPALTQIQKQSVADELVELARSKWRLFPNEKGEPCVVPIDGPWIAKVLANKDFEQELAALYYEKFRKAASKTALGEAITTLSGFALRQDRVTTHLRFFNDGSQLYVDRGGPIASFIEIGPDGWDETTTSPVVFRRTSLTSALPEPELGPDVDELLKVLNIDEHDLPIVLAWMVTAMLGLPCPILFITGEQGTGKTGAARTIAQLIDPSPAPTRAAPTSVDHWAAIASGSRIVVLDNLSSVPTWLSDVLCKAVTGEAHLKRKLYTDDGTSLVELKRAVIMTSIDIAHMRGDLRERLALLELTPIRPEDRIPESKLNRRIDELRPGILGALYMLTARVLDCLPYVELDETPRMADFAMVLEAVDQLLGTTGLDRYRAGLEQGSGDELSGDPVAAALVGLVESCDGFHGTAEHLLAVLPRPEGAAWPKTASTLSAVLRRLAPALRAVHGIDVEWRRTADRRQLSITRTRR